MKRIYLVGVGAILALVSGCETDGGLSARIREKQALYASLQHWEQLKIDRGTPGLGFTPDMVLMAMGSPSKVERERDSAEIAELWIYDRYFPLIDATHGFSYKTFTVEPFAAKKSVGAFDPSQETVSRMSGDAGRAGIGPGALKTGAPLGDAAPPPDLHSYKCLILFKAGKVVSLKAIPNVN